MTDEPIYHYVKGQGWVVSNSPPEGLFSLGGKSYRVIARKPEVGEIGSYSHYYPGTWYVNEDRSPVLKAFVGWFLTYGVKVTVTEAFLERAYFSDPIPTFVTVIPL